MNLQFGAHPIYFGLIGLNITAIFVAVAVLVIALFLRTRKKQTSLFELSFLLFVVSVAFVTFHGRLLQYFFPISLPEQPLISNNLTVNYFIANFLAYALIPILAILALNKDRRVSAEELGLKVNNTRQTGTYAGLGIIFASSIYIITNSFFHQQWVNGYTLEGLIAWVCLVTVVSVFLQTLFYAGVLFNRYVEKENTLLAGLIVVFAFQSYVAPNPFPWIVCNMLTVSSELFVTWKTKNIYGATLMAIAVGSIELALQIL
jgi:hypothetical protein